MKDDIRRASRQYLTIVAVLLFSLLLVTCLGGEQSDEPTRDYDSSRTALPQDATSSEGRAE